jgi:flagellar FliJ protein
MKRFSFRLERVLRLRRHHEQEWEIALGRITGECVRLRSRIDELRGARGHVAGESRTAYDLSHELAKAAYVVRLDAEARRLEKELAQKEEKRKEVQEEFLKASRARKVIDKLREREEASYYAEERREEARELDDIANNMSYSETEQEVPSGDL